MGQSGAFDLPVVVIGAGLAGCECALTLADLGVEVELHEMRPEVMTPAHKTGDLAELVCSNSLKATRLDSAAGLLKHELDDLGCHLLALARQASVPAGGALAVDRRVFSQLVESEVRSRPNITIVRDEVRDIASGRQVVVAAGPLCSQALFDRIAQTVGSESLSFFDAAAPIVDATSLDYDQLFTQSRYDDAESGEGDYLNSFMDREQYDRFVDELVGAERVVLRDFERGDLFQACQPAEEVARTGHDALRFGALKPVGLTDPRTGRRPWAAVQLRAEDRERAAYNLVGFQTNLTFAEQRRVFALIPGLEHAEFFRYGVMHRNTFVDAPHVLDATFGLPGNPLVHFAGQITGTEGYVEAMATGLLAALNTVAVRRGVMLEPLPKTTVLGALIGYATSPDTKDYQPMHVNFGLMPALDVSGKRLGKRERYQAYAQRAINDLDGWRARSKGLLLAPVNDAS